MLCQVIIQFLHVARSEILQVAIFYYIGTGYGVRCSLPVIEMRLNIESPQYLGNRYSFFVQFEIVFKNCILFQRIPTKMSRPDSVEELKLNSAATNKINSTPQSSEKRNSATT